MPSAMLVLRRDNVPDLDRAVLGAAQVIEALMCHGHTFRSGTCDKCKNANPIS